jgi:hypothetical protein
MDIARHKYGCSMLQRCLDYATEEQARLVSDRVSQSFGCAVAELSIAWQARK